MAVKKKKKHTQKKVSRERKIHRLSEQLAPLEESTEPPPLIEHTGDDYVDGSIIVDGTRVPVLDPFGEASEAAGFRIEPVVIVATLLALAFVAFITYLIATTPPEDAAESEALSRPVLLASS